MYNDQSALSTVLPLVFMVTTQQPLKGFSSFGAKNLPRIEFEHLSSKEYRCPFKHPRLLSTREERTEHLSADLNYFAQFPFAI